MLFGQKIYFSPKKVTVDNMVIHLGPLNRLHGRKQRFSLDRSRLIGSCYSGGCCLIKKNVFRCKVCVDSKAKNIFVSTEERRPDKSKKFQQTTRERCCCQNDNLNLIMQALRQTTMTQAKLHCLPTVTNAALIDLHVLNVSHIHRLL